MKKYMVMVTESKAVDIEAEYMENKGGVLYFTRGGQTVAIFKEWLGCCEVTP